MRLLHLGRPGYEEERPEPDHDEDQDLIKEPGCKIDNRFETNTRAAMVEGVVSYTFPGIGARVLELSTDDLSPVGATLSNQSERHFFRTLDPPVGSCVEQTG